jgi:DNA-binding NtrC family response regulator
MMLDHDVGTIPGCGKYANLRGKRILVVEDEAVIAVDYYFQLRAVGAEPKAYASTIKNALDCLAARDAIDAAIVSFELRDGSCEPVLELLVAQRIPFVVVLGFTDVVHSDFIEPEMVLSKPVAPDELYRSLSDALRMAEQGHPVGRAMSRGRGAEVPEPASRGRPTELARSQPADPIVSVKPQPELVP